MKRGAWGSAAALLLAPSLARGADPTSNASGEPGTSDASVARADGERKADPRRSEATEPTEIVVRGAPRDDRGVLVDVVDEKKIERFGAWTVGETLERLPSVYANGGSRGERILTLRGFDQRQLAIFVDGVPVYVPYDGQLDLAKLPIDMVERVTVVKGAGTMLYGPNGLGGAVSIVTRDPSEEPSLRASSESSPWRATRANVVGSAKVGPVAGIVGAGLQGVRYVPLSQSFTPLPNEDGGRRNNSDRRLGSFASKWTLDLSDEHRLTLSVSRFGGEFGVPPSTRDFTVRYWRWTDWSSSNVGIAHAYRGSRWQTEELVYGNLFSNTLDAYDDARYATQKLPKAFHSIYDDTAIGGLVRTTYQAPVGASRYLRVRTWSGLKHDIHASVADRGAPTVRVSTNILTASAQGELDVVPSWLRASMGLQIDGEIPDAPPSGPTPKIATGFGPMATLSFVPSSSWTVSASAASRTRFPTLRERFSTVFGGREPNPLLRPERAWNFALDAVYKVKRNLRVACGLFDSELRDLIVAVLVDPQTDQMQNASRGRFYGAEAEIGWSPKEWLDLSAGFMLLHARTGEALDAPVAYRPSQKGLVMATVIPWPTLSITGILRHTGPQDFQNPDTLLWGELGSFRAVDARVDWAFHPLLRAWIRATNLTDANVESRYSFPEPGREIFVGVGSRIGR